MKIERLDIFTFNLKAQLAFYEKILGLNVFNKTENTFDLKIGFSEIHFEQKNEATPYHLAFHIPAGQEELAVNWLKERTEILQGDGKDIVEFPNWNARSVYFYDADHNILEFISRRHCNPPSSNKFTADSIIGISEIGLATTEVEPVYQFLYRYFRLKKFTEFGTSFCATGDDEGLFIVIDKRQKDWFPTSGRAFASEFSVQFSNQGQKGGLAYINETLELL